MLDHLSTVGNRERRRDHRSRRPSAAGCEWSRLNWTPGCPGIESYLLQAVRGVEAKSSVGDQALGEHRTRYRRSHSSDTYNSSDRKVPFASVSGSRIRSRSTWSGTPLVGIDFAGCRKSSAHLCRFVPTSRVIVDDPFAARRHRRFGERINGSWHRSPGRHGWLQAVRRRWSSPSRVTRQPTR